MKNYSWSIFSCNQLGFTLFETLIAVSLIMLLMMFGLPSLNQFLTVTDQQIALDRIKNAIEFAKFEANRQNKIISLCPSKNQKSCHCSEDWNVGFIVFENPMGEAQPQEGSLIQISPGAQYGRIVYTATGNQLNIYPDGKTTNIGSFIYCAKNKNAGHSNSNINNPKKLVINWVARVYETVETDPKSIDNSCGY